MVKAGRKPELIVIAGPNGSGKTSVTQKFLHHEWADGTVYINPDQIANDKFGDWNSQTAVLEAANYCAEWRVEKARVFDPFGHAGLTPLGEIRLTHAGEIKMTPVEASAGEFFCSFETPCPGTAGINLKNYRI